MSVELQDIFTQAYPDYAAAHNVSRAQDKAARDIIACRTAELGTHIDVCDHCGAERISYNSCRSRYCSKCGAVAREQWLDGQRQNLLNTAYFHVVFTVPEELNGLFLAHPKDMCSLLFRAASETVLELSADPKLLGAKPAVLAVLHTWGQNLSFHPHIHMVVTGGGMTPYGTWKSTDGKFFLPVHVLSAKFRGKFLSLLEEVFPDTDKELLNTCWAKAWNVYCKPPFGGPQKVVDYLGRYTHRVAISNCRILSFEDGFVSFKWRDYADDNKLKVMTLSVEEFIRRFLMHVLPGGLHKIRYYGLLAPRGKTARIEVCRRLTGTKTPPPLLTVEEILEKILGPDFNVCPICRTGRFSRDPPASAV